MQDVDYKLIFEPGKDENDPLDFLSRHPLPETGEDETEKYIRKVAHHEHALILDRVREATKIDEVSRKLAETIRIEKWQKAKKKKDPDLASYIKVKDELYLADDTIFRQNRIVVPEKLRRKVIKTAHSMGHLGTSKIKQMVRERYWFPEMDRIIEEMVKKCYACQITTKQHRQEPVKMTEIPEKPWQTVSADFGGPYPGGSLQPCGH